MSPKKGKEWTEPYVKLDYGMLNSAAWTSLSPGAVWVYIEMRKNFNFNKGGNSHLVLSYSMVTWKMNSRTYKVKKQELIDKGFIRVVEPGGLLNNPSIYALTNDWEKISREIVDKEGREAIRIHKKKNPQQQPSALRDNIRNRKQ